MSDNWNDRLKTISTSVASRIPYVGFLVKGLLEELWPSSELDIWSLIVRQATDLVDNRILKAEIESLEGDLGGLRSSMERYGRARDDEKGSLMSAMLAIADGLYARFESSSNSFHLLPVAAVAVHVHLGLLLERLAHGAEIYGEDNSPVWKSELEEQYGKYVSWFTKNVVKWQEWREGQIEIRSYTTTSAMALPPFFQSHAHGYVHDRVTGTKYEYEEGLNSVDDYFKKLVTATRQRLLREAIARMVSDLSSTFLLHVYLPGQENNPPRVYDPLRTLWLGPYSEATLGWNRHAPYSTDIEDTPGEITKILVREGDAIDGLQFFYRDHPGDFVGNPRGGQAHEVAPAPGDYFTGLKFMFTDGVLCRVDINFAKGAAQSFGNRSKKSGIETPPALMLPPYFLRGVKYRKGRSRSAIVGISVIELRFDAA